MTALKSKRAFSLGKLYMTQGVMNCVPAMDIWHSVMRHANCDWGDVCDEDRGLNDASLENDSRLLSIYTASNAKRFWIITEWDRSVTTVLLPEEY